MSRRRHLKGNPNLWRGLKESLVAMDAEPYAKEKAAMPEQPPHLHAYALFMWKALVQIRDGAKPAEVLRRLPGCLELAPRELDRQAMAEAEAADAEDLDSPPNYSIG
jgi:hypothetical protein